MSAKNTTAAADSAEAASDRQNLLLALGILLVAGGWWGYKKLASNPQGLAAVDVHAIAILALPLVVAAAAGAHVVWRAVHPRGPDEEELDRWRLRFPTASATVGTAAATFAAMVWLLAYQLGTSLQFAAGLGLAVALAAATFAAEHCYRLLALRTALRSDLIQALYHPLGHRQPQSRIVTKITWAKKAAVPETLEIRAYRPITSTWTADDDTDDIGLHDDAKSATRPDAKLVIRRNLRKHCAGEHYRVSADPSGIRFTATRQVREEVDEDLADLTRKVRDIFGSTASVSGDRTAGFTINHQSSSKLTGEFRKRVAEQNLGELVGGSWVFKWDMQQSSVHVTPKPDLPRIVYPTPVPLVHSLPEAIAQYGQTRLAYGVDLDLNVQEWDPLDAPHTLVGGKTGAGKTVYLRTKIMQAARRGWAVVIVDFKGGSFADLAGWPNVHIISSDPFESIATVHRMYKLMNERNAQARWNPKAWEKNLPYLVVIDEAAQFKVVLTRLWNSGLKPKNGPKEPPTLTELGELARLSRTTRIHLELGMQRPDHDLIDTEARDNFGNKVSVGPISRIAAEMLFEDSYTGRSVPRIKGRGMSIGTHEQPRETQYYFSPAADTTDPEEMKMIAAMRPPATLIPRWVPQLPDIDDASWNLIADAPWFALAERPDLDPALISRTVTQWDGDAALGFDQPGTEDLTVPATQLQPKDVVTIDGHRGEVDGIDVDEATGTVTVMWQDADDGRLCVSSTTPAAQFDIERSQNSSS